MTYKNSTNILSNNLKKDLDILIGNLSQTLYEEIGVEYGMEEEIEVYKYLIMKLQLNLDEARREMIVDSNK